METMMIVNVVISLSFLLGGVGMMGQGKKQINPVVGYRTKRSMASNEAWMLSNRKCGIMWLINGGIGFVLTALSYLLMFKISDKVSFALQILILLLMTAGAVFSIIKTEKMLKDRENSAAAKKEEMYKNLV